jgi:large-conductance mechanosensitive channel
MSGSFLVVDVSSVKEQLKKFIIDNGIVGTTAGVCIALATKDLIVSFVGDVIIPGILFLLIKLKFSWLDNYLPGKINLKVGDFIKNLISWVFVLLVTFLFIKTAFEGIIGAKNEKNDSKKDEPPSQQAPTMPTPPSVATASVSTQPSPAVKESFYSSF